MKTQSVVQDSIDTLIDVLNTQAFAEDQIKDALERAHTGNLGRHSRAQFQRDCNFTDRHSSFPSPHPPLPLSLKLPSQNPFTVFHVLELFRLSRTLFLCPCAPMLAQWSAS